MSMAQKIAKIKNGMNTFEKKRSKPGRLSFDDIVKGYLNPILPVYWDVFHERNISRRESGDLLSREDDNNFLPCYDVGIFLVGFSNLPIALSLAEIQPIDHIYFLYSKDTKKECYKIADRMQAMLTGHSCFTNLIDRVDTIVLDIQENNNSLGHGLEVDDPSDPVKTFKLIKTVIDKVGDKRIALDLTGGKKTMIGGGFTAGSIWASKWSEAAKEFIPFCDMFYIDSLKYDADLSAPVPGHEFLSQLKNPYDIYNVQSNLEAEKLFEKHNYEAAAELWDQADEKLNHSAEPYGLEDEQRAIEKKLYMADCYGLWDAFDYINAGQSKRNHGDLWDYNTKHTHNSHHLIIDVLEILSQVPRQVSSQVNAVITDRGTISSDEVRTIHHKTLFNDEVQIIHYAIDRYQNGIRRKDNDRYDDAIVRFAQVIEILCLYQIYRIASEGYLRLNNHDVLPDDCLAERWRISGLIILLFGQDRYWKSGEFYYYIHDMQLNICEYDGYTDAKEITDIIDIRHDFVHVRDTPVWQVMEKNAENLKDLAREFLENFSGDYCSANSLSFNDLLGLHEFQKLK